VLWLAFIGAAVGAIVTYGVASVGRGGPTPIKLAIVGAAVTALCFALTTMLALRDLDALNVLRFWSVGSLTSSHVGALRQAGGFILVGAVMALACGRAMNALALGEDVARSQGQRVGVTRLFAAVAIVLLAGGATAVAGPIIFLGLVIPHIARSIVGPDYRWVLAYSLLLAPILLLGADVVGRKLAEPAEVPVGIVMVMIGCPFFVALVRRRRLAEL
jgi:iron complex transport system permease protein